MVSLVLSDFFRECTKLSKIPSDLFKNFISVTKPVYLSSFFKQTIIEQIPDGLLQFFRNSKSVSVSELFYGTKITSIPENLFSGLNIIRADDCFANTQISEIPENLFENCHKIKSVGGRYTESYSDGLFENCTNLSIVPKNLFKNQLELVNIGKNISGLFQNCTNISTDIYLYSRNIDGDLGNGVYNHWIGKQKSPINIWIYTKNEDGTESKTYQTFKNCKTVHYELNVTNELNLTLKALD